MGTSSFPGWFLYVSLLTWVFCYLDYARLGRGSGSDTARDGGEQIFELAVRGLGTGQMRLCSPSLRGKQHYDSRL